MVKKETYQSLSLPLEKPYSIILNYYNTACFIAYVMPRRKSGIAVARMRTLAKTLNEPGKYKNIISKQTEQDVHFANFSKQNAHVLRFKKKKRCMSQAPDQWLIFPRDNKR